MTLDPYLCVGLPPDFPSSSRVSKRIPLHDDSVCKYPGCNKPRCVKDSETNEMFDCCDVNHGRMLQEKKQRDLIASGRMIKPKGTYIYMYTYLFNH